MSEAPSAAADAVTEVSEGDAEEPRSALDGWGRATLLFFLTVASTWYVGAQMEVEGEVTTVAQFLTGWRFSVPLMAILLAHELGHYVAGRLHGVDISPPYFIPMPMMFLGTLGAVIRMRGTIKSRDALLDVGASGPIAGFIVALPILIYGMATSPVELLPAESGYIIEGRGLLYLGLLAALKGDIAAGHDIMLNSFAFAGWAGLLVTMINLIPVAQLDGGHVAYSLVGKRQDRFSLVVTMLLPLLGIGVGLFYGIPSWREGVTGDRLFGDFMAGAQWVFWAVLLCVMMYLAGREHPPTTDAPLSPKRRLIAIGTLVLFVLLFMPSWVRLQ